MAETKEKILKDVDVYPKRDGKKTLVSSAGVSKAIERERTRAITEEERLADKIDELRKGGIGGGSGATGWTGWTGWTGYTGSTGWTGWTGPRGLPGGGGSSSLPTRTVRTSGHTSEIELTFIDGDFREMKDGDTVISRMDIISKGERGTESLADSFRYQYSNAGYVILNPETEEMSGGTSEFTWTATPEMQTVSSGTITAEEGSIDGFKECFDVCAEYMRDAIASNVNSISQILLKLYSEPVLPITVKQGEGKFKVSIDESGENPVLKVEKIVEEEG